MTSYYLKRSLFATTVMLYLFCVQFVHANDSQILSVTPPLFQLSALRGDIWQSSIKVTNVNTYPLTVYTEVVNFEAIGENGQGKFSPVLNAEEGVSTLANWISVAQGPYTIPPEQANEISFFVDIPKDAPPGGHYAAILISTEPPQNTEKYVVKTSQAVTALFFLRIEGDVEESGTIREFKALDSLLPRPEAEFSLRFENKGNVHLQPRGNIVITNMWGTERGVIPVNYQTHFGNVLPKSIRDFNFMWQSEFSITDIGRYKAIATLAYGEDGVKTASSIAHFWVIPIKVTLMTLAVLALFVGLVVWMIKAYVRRMFVLAGVSVPSEKTLNTIADKEPQKIVSLKQKISYKKVSAPLRNGVLDLRTRLHDVNQLTDVSRTLSQFIYTYKTFFISVAVLICIFVSVSFYIQKATEEHQNFKVIIDQGDTTTTLDGSDITPEKE